MIFQPHFYVRTNIRFEAVIFDMDGTLLDSMDVYNPLFVELTVTNIIG